MSKTNSGRAPAEAKGWGRPALRGLFLLAFLVGGLGCWPFAQGEAPWGDEDPPPLQLHVQNHHFHDVVIYVHPDGQRKRLGAVGGFENQTLSLPPDVVSAVRSFRISANPIGSRASYTSEEISGGPGQTVVLTVAGTLQMSHWHIR